MVTAILPAPSAAQVEFDPSVAYSTAFLPHDHWSAHAVRRLAALGLAGELDPALRQPTQREAGEVLFHAARLDAVISPGLLELVRSYDALFRQEFAAPSPAEGSVTESARSLADWFVGSSALGGYIGRTGVVTTGWGYDLSNPAVVRWHEPTPRPDVQGENLAAALQFNPHHNVALRVAGTLQDGKDRLVEAYAAGRMGRVALWAGRREIAYGPGTEGIVLSPTPFDGFGLQTAEAFGLPWLLSYLGPIHIGAALGWRDLPHSFDDVAFLTTRGSMAPHPRLRLGLSRAAFFGGDGNGGVELFDIVSVLIGKHAGDVASELDNQVVAVDVDLRLPTERWLPLRLYVEWGFEDSAGAWRSVPGILAGAEVPAVPGLPTLSLAVERTSFAASCCGNPVWYRHSNFQDGWTLNGQPMAHPLAGHGDEWVVRTDLALLDARLRFRARGFLRWRGDENLYAPNREGDSRGFDVEGELDFGGALRLEAGAVLEDGQGWRQTTANIGLRAIL